MCALKRYSSFLNEGSYDPKTFYKSRETDKLTPANKNKWNVCLKNAEDHLKSALHELLNVPQLTFTEEIPDYIKELRLLLNGDDGGGFSNFVKRNRLEGKMNENTDTELQEIHDVLRTVAPKNCRIENMGTGCLWVQGKSLKELNTLADTMRAKFPNATFRVNTLGGVKKMTVLA